MANDFGGWTWGVSFGDGFAGGIGKKRTLCVADISKDYVKVKFSPGTNGTLEGSTVFYVLKNKETNLTAPEIIPNK